MFDQIVEELKQENALGLLLAAQLGTTPAELAMAVRTVVVNPQTGQLSPLGYHSIKLGSLIEHKMMLGPFNHAAVMDDHPILYHHNSRSMKVFITGKAENPEQVYLEIVQAHAHVFGPYRNIENDLNKRTEPEEVLGKGMGALGEFPEPFAMHIAKILADHQISANMIPGDAKIGGFKLLAFDDSYFVARVIDVEPIKDDQPS